jgi:hypothetical protein
MVIEKGRFPGREELQALHSVVAIDAAQSQWLR